jgi:hypothetical protein
VFSERQLLCHRSRAGFRIGDDRHAHPLRHRGGRDLRQDNPTLMRLRELEVLERVAAGGKLNVVLGEKGLAERIVNLL